MKKIFEKNLIFFSLIIGLTFVPKVFAQTNGEVVQQQLPVCTCDAAYVTESENKWCGEKGTCTLTKSTCTKQSCSDNSGRCYFKCTHKCIVDGIVVTSCNARFFQQENVEPHGPDGF